MALNHDGFVVDTLYSIKRKKAPRGLGMSDVGHHHHRHRHRHQRRQREGEGETRERKRGDADGTGMMTKVAAPARTKRQEGEQRKPGTLYRAVGLSGSSTRFILKLICKRTIELFTRLAYHHYFTDITSTSYKVYRVSCCCTADVVGLFNRIRRQLKYREKVALKKAQRRAAESAEEKAERKRKANIDHTAAHFGCVMESISLLVVFISKC